MIDVLRSLPVRTRPFASHGSLMGHSARRERSSSVPRPRRNPSICSDFDHSRQLPATLRRSFPSSPVFPGCFGSNTGEAAPSAIVAQFPSKPVRTRSPFSETDPAQGWTSSTAPATEADLLHRPAVDIDTDARRRSPATAATRCAAPQHGGARPPATGPSSPAGRWSLPKHPATPDSRAEACNTWVCQGDKYRRV